MDFVPNHTAAEHDWFQKSRQRIIPYNDYYVWHPGHPEKKVIDKHGKERPAPPNNWISVFGGSMWAWDDMRQEYFLHQFMRDQPDLDFRNPNVLKEIEDIFRFWCDKGVDGFRIDALKHVFEEKDLLDNHELEDPHRPTNNPVRLRFGAYVCNDCVVQLLKRDFLLPAYRIIIYIFNTKKRAISPKFIS